MQVLLLEIWGGPRDRKEEGSERDGVERVVIKDGQAGTARSSSGEKTTWPVELKKNHS